MLPWPRVERDGDPLRVIFVPLEPVFVHKVDDTLEALEMSQITAAPEVTAAWA